MVFDGKSRSRIARHDTGSREALRHEASWSREKNGCCAPRGLSKNERRLLESSWEEQRVLCEGSAEDRVLSWVVSTPKSRHSCNPSWVLLIVTSASKSEQLCVGVRLWGAAKSLEIQATSAPFQPLYGERANCIGVTVAGNCEDSAPTNAISTNRRN